MSLEVIDTDLIIDLLQSEVMRLRAENRDLIAAQMSNNKASSGSVEAELAERTLNGSLLPKIPTKRSNHE